MIDAINMAPNRSRESGEATSSLKERDAATYWTRLSRRRFQVKEVRLLLAAVAYNVGNPLRRLVTAVTFQS